jgi:hypothetical protein
VHKGAKAFMNLPLYYNLRLHKSNILEKNISYQRLKVYQKSREIIGDYSVDSIKRTVHLAFHGLIYGIFNRDFLK